MTSPASALPVQSAKIIWPNWSTATSSTGPRLLVLLPALFIAGTFGLATAVFVWNGFSGGPAAPDAGLTFDNYRRVLGDSYNWRVLFTTTRISLIVVVLTALISYPLALAIARNRTWWAQLFLGVVLASSTMSLVIRALGWIGLLDTNGWLNAALSWLGVISRPMRILGTETGVIIGLVHGFVPLLTLTLVPVLQNIDPALEDAAAGLGAQRWEQLWRVTLPLSMPGLISGSFLVFAMSMGAYTTPALLGGGRTVVFSELIQQQVLLLLDFHSGAVLAITLLALVLTAVGIASALTRVRLQGLGA